MTYNEIVREVAERNGLTIGFVDSVYKSYWKAIRQYVTSLPLKKELTDEEFLRLRPNINIPSIGKLYITLDRYKRLKKQQKIFNEIKNNKNVTHQED